MKSAMDRHLQGINKREDNRVKELQQLKAQVHHQKNIWQHFNQDLDKRSEKLREQVENLREREQMLESKEAELKTKKKRFQKELQYLDEVNKVTDSIIKLNVGGHVFVTSSVTLTREPDSMLAAMFSGRHQLRTTPDGAVFIDRDGTHFRHILNYLRDADLRQPVLPEDPQVVQELIVEADYFQLQGLLDLLQGTQKSLIDDAAFESECLCLGAIFLDSSDEEC